MAESRQRLSDGLKETHTEIDWQRIAGFRNVLVHDYLGVDVERVWNIIETELPAFEKAIRTMMDSQGSVGS